MSNRVLQIVVFAFSLLIAIYFGFFQSRDETLKSREIFQKRKISIDPSGKPAGVTNLKPSRNLASVLPTDPPIGRLKAALSLDEVIVKYGSAYEFTKDTSGVVTRIRKSGDDVHGVRRFSPNRYSDLVARAEEIVRDMRGILGLDPTLPFGAPEVMTGENTGQVTFIQSLEGKRVEPWGKVSVLLNRDGSIEQIQSNALKTSKVMNSNRNEKRFGSRRIAWVEQLEPVPQLRFADETRERGIQRVYDADTGGLLFERDRRDRFARRSKKLHY